MTSPVCRTVKFITTKTSNHSAATTAAALTPQKGMKP